jgi:hypothetical protein
LRPAPCALGVQPQHACLRAREAERAGLARAQAATAISAMSRFPMAPPMVILHQVLHFLDDLPRIAEAARS